VKPLTVIEAGILTGQSVDEIARAMQTGLLDWKRHNGVPATTRRWLRNWQRVGR
jgi:hypothetical protein